ncbi:hypothetical protein [Comamonas resistens]|uniref:hypothetical protein n=1 Tax=Comamonas resistens TaxID=3046670 RepID=UPI0039BCE60A
MKYFYSGPTSGVTLQEGEKPREVMLHAQTEVDLPTDNEYTKTLLALGYLKPVTVDAQPKPAKAAPATSKGD